MKYKCAVLVGRFQPYHLGHKDLIRQALNVADNVLILIGSTEQARSARNPFTFEERKRMIQEDWNPTDPITIMSLRDDPYDMATWLHRVQETVRAGTTARDSDICLIGVDKDATTTYLRMFPQWKLQSIEHTTPSLNATTVREQYFLDNSSLRKSISNVPASTKSFLTEFFGSDGYDAVKAEMEYAIRYRDEYSYKAHPKVAPIFCTVDAVVIQAGSVILVKRGGHPGKGLGALPGGFVNAGEELEDAAVRELIEETQIDVPASILRNSIKARYTFDAPHRSSRGRVISHGFLIDLDGEYMSRGRAKGKFTNSKIKGSDDAVKASWIQLNDLDSSRMFEDHYAIIQKLLSLKP